MRWGYLCYESYLGINLLPIASAWKWWLPLNGHGEHVLSAELNLFFCLSAQFSPLFNVSFTQDERFYVNKYVVVMVPMMFRADKYFLAYDRLLKVGVLKLPMGDGKAMLVVLPDEDVDVIDVEEKMTGEKIRAWIRQLKKTWERPASSSPLKLFL